MSNSSVTHISTSFRILRILTDIFSNDGLIPHINLLVFSK